jgi:hypothetical protein
LKTDVNVSTVPVPSSSKQNTSVVDPDLGSGTFLIPGSEIRDGKKIRIRIRISFPRSLETILWVNILKFFDVDLGWKKFGSATLQET